MELVRSGGNERMEGQRVCIKRFLEAQEGEDVRETEGTGLLRTARETSTGSVVSDELSDRVWGGRKRGRSRRRRRKGNRTRRLEYGLGFLFGAIIGVFLNSWAAGGDKVTRGEAEE